MLSPLRNRFGIPGVISVVALVFAMLGGAYAANNSGDGKATASAKAKKGPRGPKGATGPAGPAGPVGPQGAAGVNGKDGANGSNGSNGAPGSAGAPGDSVVATEVGPGVECAKGGTTFTIDGADAGKACNGADGAPGAPGANGAPGASGSPWVVGTAPPDAILRGTWSISHSAVGAGEKVWASISTGVPVGNLEVLVSDDPTFDYGSVDPEAPEIIESICPGSAANPTVSTEILLPSDSALCMYVASSTNLDPPPPNLFVPGAWELGVPGGGVLASFATKGAGPASARGTWVLITGG